MFKSAKQKVRSTIKPGHPPEPRSSTFTPPPILHLQQTIGNQAVQRWIQRAITIDSVPGQEEPNSLAAAEVWGLLVEHDHVPVIAKASVMEDLEYYDENDKHFEDLDDLLDEMGGYELELQGENVFFEFWEREETVQEAEDLIMAIKMEYGISLDSQKSIEAISANLDMNKDEFGEKHYQRLKKNLNQRYHESWTMEDLNALESALQYFAPILGRKREKSPRGDYLQEITSFGKVDSDVEGWHTMAETFQQNNHIVLYDDGRDEHDESPDYEEKVKTFVHELTHGLLEHRADDFKQSIYYWKWVGKQQRLEETTPGYSRPDFEGETPPTAVAEQSVFEDLAESVMLYFTENTFFRQNYPERYSIVNKIIRQEFGRK